VQITYIQRQVGGVRSVVGGDVRIWSFNGPFTGTYLHRIASYCHSKMDGPHGKLEFVVDFLFELHKDYDESL